MPGRWLVRFWEQELLMGAHRERGCCSVLPLRAVPWQILNAQPVDGSPATQPTVVKSRGSSRVLPDKIVAGAQFRVKWANARVECAYRYPRSYGRAGDRGSGNLVPRGTSLGSRLSQSKLVPVSTRLAQHPTAEGANQPTGLGIILWGATWN